MSTQAGRPAVPTSSLAIASLILGVDVCLVSGLILPPLVLAESSLPFSLAIIFLLCLALVAGAIALISGYTGSGRIRKSEGKLAGAGLAETGYYSCPAPTSRLAIASLILGVDACLVSGLMLPALVLAHSSVPLLLVIIVSLWLALVAAALAVILGSIGSDRIRNSEGKLRGVGLAGTGYYLGWVSAVAAAMVLLLSGVVLGNARPFQQIRGELRCEAKLDQLGLAMAAYSADYGGFLPCDERGPLYSLSLLYPRYVSDPTMFLCPSAGRRTVTRFPPGCSLAGQPCSYGYDNETKPRAMTAHPAILACMPGNHLLSVPMLWLDGYVQTPRYSTDKELQEDEIFHRDASKPPDEDAYIRQ